MRVLCDLFGITGAPAGTVGLANLAVFILTLLLSVFFIYLKGLLNHKHKQKATPVPAHVPSPNH